MLKLDLIKRNILPKICSQQYEAKITNHKKYDELLNPSRPSIKIQLSKITKVFKKFIFQQNL